MESIARLGCGSLLVDDDRACMTYGSTAREGTKRRTRRRPSGAPAPPPHLLRTAGLGWLIGLVGVLVATFVVFHDGIRGAAIGAGVIDDTIVRWVSSADVPGFYKASRMLTAITSWWVIQVLS